MLNLDFKQEYKSEAKRITQLLDTVGLANITSTSTATRHTASATPSNNRNVNAKPSAATTSVSSATTDGTTNNNNSNNNNNNNNIRSHNLSIDAYVQHLAALATTLRLNDVKTHTYELALSDLFLKQQDVQERCRTEDNIADWVDIKHEDARLQLDRLEKVRAELAAERPDVHREVREWSNHTSLMAQKGLEYKEGLRINKIKFESSLAGKDNLSFRTVQALENELNTISKQLSEKKAELHSFRDLPPDTMLAKLKLASAERELTELKMTREHVIGAIAEASNFD